MARRTKKYLFALAARIPCVSFKWVEECLRTARVQDYRPFMLESGVSFATNRAGSQMMVLDPAAPVFSGLAVAVLGGPQFQDMFRVVLEGGGARVVLAPTSPAAVPREAIVLCEDDNATAARETLEARHLARRPAKSVDGELLRRLHARGASFVSREWVIQCLVQGRIVSADDAPAMRLAVH
eukprot:Unigene14344_Nuclearia_a/m.43282 Unigene14344_Nuclearia_a/g.43282  ORF Unigene14344_Nuclearia_a/g.43282 Unigene14344_Nuclearia_a/m.43282 type:complete len:182 (-) Unigene14344_Nuclearia_a:53-598(-)